MHMQAPCINKSHSHLCVIRQYTSHMQRIESGSPTLIFSPSDDPTSGRICIVQLSGWSLLFQQPQGQALDKKLGAMKVQTICGDSSFLIHVASSWEGRYYMSASS
ncbi:hypothetical protein SLA2020_225410 [Shorea laevis]